MLEEPTYKARQVVIAYVPYMDGNNNGKKRPVIILEIQEEYKYAICCCTTKDRSAEFKGKVIEPDSLDNDFFGFNEKTFINYEEIGVIFETEIDHIIGYCDNMTWKEIMPHFEKSPYKSSNNS